MKYLISFWATSKDYDNLSVKNTITEIAEMSGLFFQESLDYDQDLISKTFNEEADAILTDFKSALGEPNFKSSDTWNRSEIELIFEKFNGTA